MAATAGPVLAAGRPHMVAVLVEAGRSRGVMRRSLVWMNGRGQRPPERSVGAFEAGIELERPGHRAAGITIFACPPACRNCHGPYPAVQAREDVIVMSGVCEPSTSACKATRFEVSTVLADSNQRLGRGRCGLWHAIRHARRRVPALGDL